jgi:hypothetical protein
VGRHLKFSAPGHDGELPPETNFWRKGMVYTTRSPGSPDPFVRHGYRVTAAIKCGGGAWSSQVGFSKLYHRVKEIAAGAISKKTCAETGETPVAIISSNGWRSFGDGDGIATAFIVMEVRCSPPSAAGEQSQCGPPEEALLLPGGASLEELMRVSPQRADEIYNEFDFTEPFDHGLITLSYGEPISGPALDFEPIVQRAERLAESYHSLLKSVGEAHSVALKVIRREWFLANENFATVQICFDR